VRPRQRGARSARAALLPASIAVFVCLLIASLVNLVLR